MSQRPGAFGAHGSWRAPGSVEAQRSPPGNERRCRQVTETTGGAPEWGGKWDAWRRLGQLTMEARMGRKRVVVATLLVHSVKVATRRQRIKAMAGGDTLCSGVSLSPSNFDRPDSCGQKRVVCEGGQAAWGSRVSR